MYTFNSIKKNCNLETYVYVSLLIFCVHSVMFGSLQYSWKVTCQNNSALLYYSKRLFKNLKMKALLLKGS